MSSPEQDVAAIDDIPLAGMKTIEVDDKKVLLVRDGDAIHAIGATCPHAGAPLEQGVRNGRRLVCPWHKAVFCIETGALLEPPAVDPLPQYLVRVVAGRVLVTTDAVAPDTRTIKPDTRTFVIVGAGAAGAVAAQTLREEGFGGAIITLDAANRVPYDRTVLSKYHLSGEEGGEKTPLQSQDFYREHAIERRTATVTRLDASTRTIECADGAILRFDKALVATGAAPAPLDLSGHDLDNVFTLRSRADADAILAQAERSMRAVVLGASFIGMEVAASLRERGLDVTVIGKEKMPFEAQLGAEVGAAFVALHERRGVRLQLGEQIAAIEGDRSVEAVRLKSGALIAADLVVVGFGVKPATAFLHGVKLARDGGVQVDATLRAADDLFAAGDIAHFPSGGDGDRIRVEHWRVAQQHGRIAACNMLGQAVRFTAPPVFWTIQYRKRMDYIGHVERWDDIVVHGDLTKPEFLAYYIKDGRVAAAIGMDRDQDTAALGELLAKRSWTAAELGDDPKGLLERLADSA